MKDLFPDSLHPEVIGFDAIRHVAPMFFAIYPPADDLQRIVAWQQRVCRHAGLPHVVARPPALLHVSVALCGTPKQQRKPLEVALRLAGERFSCSSFELTLDVSASFGGDDRAFVAVADAAGMQSVHGLRIALADAQKPFGLSGERGMTKPHLTLGYGDDLPEEHLPIEPISLHVGAVDLVVSHVGHAEHLHVARWLLA